jgi:hypothetical protein
MSDPNISSTFILKKNYGGTEWINPPSTYYWWVCWAKEKPLLRSDNTALMNEDVWYDLLSGTVKIFNGIEFTPAGVIGNSNGGFITQNVEFRIVDQNTNPITQTGIFSFYGGDVPTRIYQMEVQGGKFSIRKANGEIVMEIDSSGDATFTKNVTVVGDLFADDVGYDEALINILRIEDRIEHNGDANNKISFETDKMTLDAAGTSIVLDNAAMTDKIVVTGQTKFVNNVTVDGTLTVDGIPIHSSGIPSGGLIPNNVSTVILSDNPVISRFNDLQAGQYIGQELTIIKQTSTSGSLYPPVNSNFDALTGTVESCEVYGNNLLLVGNFASGVKDSNGNVIPRTGFAVGFNMITQQFYSLFIGDTFATSFNLIQRITGTNKYLVAGTAITQLNSFAISGGTSLVLYDPDNPFPGSQWVVLKTGAAPTANILVTGGTINAVTSDPTTGLIYFGGAFNNVNGISFGRFAVYDPVALTVSVPTATNGVDSGAIFDFQWKSDYSGFYTCGSFNFARTMAGNIPNTGKLVFYDKSAGWFGFGAGLDLVSGTAVNSIFWDEPAQKLYFVGNFNGIANLQTGVMDLTGIFSMGVWDAIANNATRFAVGNASQLRSVKKFNGKLYVGSSSAGATNPHYYPGSPETSSTATDPANAALTVNHCNIGVYEQNEDRIIPLSNNFPNTAIGLGASPNSLSYITVSGVDYVVYGFGAKPYFTIYQLKNTSYINAGVLAPLKFMPWQSTNFQTTLGFSNGNAGAPVRTFPRSIAMSNDGDLIKLVWDGSHWNIVYGSGLVFFTRVHSGW